MKQSPTQFAVLGLGRFGMSIVKTLADYDVNILAVDRDSNRLHDVVEYATHAIQADVADETALKKLGLGNFDVVILAMGEDFEASLIATMMAKEQGAQHIIVKARGPRQKKILESIGADQVVLPELEMGASIARRLVGSSIVDILSESDGFNITEMRPLKAWVGRTIRNADIRQTSGVNILCVRRGGEFILPVSPDLVLEKDDVLVTLMDKHKPL